MKRSNIFKDINRIIDMNAYITNVKMKTNTIGLFDKTAEDFVLQFNKKDCGVDCTPRVAAEKADQILNMSIPFDYMWDSATPIVKIIKGFGIDVRKSICMPDGISGIIYAGGKTKELYNADKVIFTDSNDPFAHQRFVMAHELAHYFFDYLGNPKYQHSNDMFVETYPRENHMSEKEIRANRFASELLMPEKLFVKKYNHVIDESNSRFFTIKYLARYFQVKESSVEKRIHEVLFDAGC